MLVFLVPVREKACVVQCNAPRGLPSKMRCNSRERVVGGACKHHGVMQAMQARWNRVQCSYGCMFYLIVIGEGGDSSDTWRSRCYHGGRCEVYGQKCGNCHIIGTGAKVQSQFRDAFWSGTRPKKGMHLTRTRRLFSDIRMESNVCALFTQRNAEVVGVKITPTTTSY